MKYRYFMSHRFMCGAGSSTVERDAPITDMEEIRAIERELNEKHPNNGKHVITFWRRFEDPI